MPDVGVNGLVFDPNAMGAPPGGLQPPPAPAPPQQQPIEGVQATWARIQDYAKRGLISPAQMQMLSQKLGIVPPPRSLADHAQGGTDAASNLGGVAGAAIGGLARSAGRALTPTPEIELQHKALQQQVGPEYPPSPQWNQ